MELVSAGLMLIAAICSVISVLQGKLSAQHSMDGVLQQSMLVYDRGKLACETVSQASYTLPCDCDGRVCAVDGEWITAYQADQKTRLRVVLSTSMRGGIASGTTIRPPTNTREVSGAPRKMLDAVFLLKHCYVEEPSDLCVCNISGEGLKVVSLNGYTLCVGGMTTVATLKKLIERHHQEDRNCCEAI